MTSRENIFNKMAKKQKVELNKTANKLRDMSASKQELSQQEQKIQSLIEEKQNSIQKADSKYQLQSLHWFSVELSDQLEITQARASLVEKEMSNVRKQLSKDEYRLTIINEKYKDARQENKREAEEKQERERISRNSN